MEEYGVGGIDVRKLGQGSEAYELDEDNCLMFRRSDAIAGVEPSTVVVMPACALPAELAPQDALAERWTWRLWAMWQAHNSLLGGHTKFDKAYPRLKRWC